MARMFACPGSDVAKGRRVWLALRAASSKLPRMKKKTGKSPGKTRTRAAAAAPKAEQIQKSQAERLLEVARQARQGGGGQSFARAMGKDTLSKNARKIGKGLVGGSNV